MKTNKQFKLKKHEILEFNDTCFAFKERDYNKGCNVLIVCNCYKCSFYKSKAQHNEDMKKHPYSDMYTLNEKK